MPSHQGQASKGELKVGKKLKPTLTSDSDSDLNLSTTMTKALKAWRQGRRSRPVTLPDKEDEVDNSKDAETPTTTKINSKKSIHLITTSMAPNKKRTASEAYPSPPRTKKRIRISIGHDGEKRLEVMDIEVRPPEPKRATEPLDSALSERDHADRVYPILNKGLTPQDFWDEDRFDLSSPRLVRPLPLRYTLVEETSPLASGLRSRFFLPDTPADDIRKVLFLHPARTDIRWVGRLSERKLAEEVKKYERVKKFWLFNHGHAYCPGRDRKHEFAAVEFAEELQSPWVVAWLAELIGRRDVCLVLEHLEWRLREELDGLEKMEKVKELEDL